MDLIDGLKQYETTPYYSWALCLEKDAKHVLGLIRRYNNNPPEFALKEVHQFLTQIEKWKAGCLQQRMGNANRNSHIDIWNVLHAASTSVDDLETLLAIMELKGFGSSYDDETGQRRAKVATSVLRFLWPIKWGVVDWRVAAILGFMKKNNWFVEKSVNEAKLQPAKEFREVFNIINETAAIEYINQYREISNQYLTTLPRAADVDMAVFGLSLFAWPMH